MPSRRGYPRTEGCGLQGHARVPPGGRAAPAAACSHQGRHRQGTRRTYQKVRVSGEKVTHGQTDPRIPAPGPAARRPRKGVGTPEPDGRAAARSSPSASASREFQKDAKQAEAILSNQVGEAVGAWGISQGKREFCRL